MYNQKLFKTKLSMNLGAMIKWGNQASLQDHAKTLIFLRHHLHEGLKNEYLMIKDLFALWSDLKERYDHKKIVILPKARYDWMHLRLQDFKTISEYNFTLVKINYQLKLCGEKNHKRKHVRIKFYYISCLKCAHVATILRA